jgi:HK97 family phage major capsid protein
VTITEMKAELVRLSNEAQGLQNTADAQGRSLTAEEQAAIDNNLSKFETLTAEVERRERIEASAARLSATAPRKAGPVIISKKTPVEFQNSSEFFRAVVNAASGQVDPRLITNGAGDYVQEGTPADGGYALVTDARSEILSAIVGPETLFGRLESIFTTGNSITLPVDEDPAWATGGFHGHAISEAGSYTAGTPQLGQLAITLAKKGTLVYVTDEMLSDVANIGGFVTRKSAEKLGWMIDAAVWSAMIGAASIKTVAKTSGAAAGSAPDLDNIEAMWVGLHTGFRKNAVWLANPNLEPHLRSLVLATYNPVYMPAGGISAAPFATLLGKPVIYSEHCAAIGTTGDLLLADPSAFYGVMRNGGIQNSVSAHFKFDQDLQAFKASVRMAAISKLKAVITRPDSTTCSNVVALATRS